MPIHAALALAFPSVFLHDAPMERLSGLPPLCPENPRLLVLGSFPSARSLAKGEYYGHERNHFWGILSIVFDEPCPADYEGKKLMLARHGIAVWDAIAECEREGSLDASIGGERPNELVAFLAARPTIRAIGLNGGKSAVVFKRLFLSGGGMPRRIGEPFDFHLGLPNRSMRTIRGIRLPSSSPIPTKRYKTAADKAGVWREFLTGL